MRWKDFTKSNTAALFSQLGLFFAAITGITAYIYTPQSVLSISPFLLPAVFSFAFFLSSITLRRFTTIKPKDIPRTTLWAASLIAAAPYLLNRAWLSSPIWATTIVIVSALAIYLIYLALTVKK